MKIKLIVFIILILILSACKDNTNIQNTKISLPPDIAKTAIDYKTYISNKKDKIAYIRPEGVYVYTPATKENKFLISSTSINSETEVNIDGWSPDDKYIVCDTGSYIESQKTVINIQTNKIIIQFGTIEISYAWINPDEIIFTDLQLMKPSFPRPYMGSAYGIAIINLNTGEKIILKQATETENYVFMKLDKDNKILFSKTTYDFNKTEESRYRTEKTTSWIMDRDGKNEKRIEYKDNKWQVIK